MIFLKINKISFMVTQKNKPNRTFDLATPFSRLGVECKCHPAERLIVVAVVIFCAFLAPL
jgi:hypothetical protein